MSRCLRVPMFSRCSRTPTCDRQTDRQTHGHSIYRASIASRGNNCSPAAANAQSPDVQQTRTLQNYTTRQMALRLDNVTTCHPDSVASCDFVACGGVDRPLLYISNSTVHSAHTCRHTLTSNRDDEIRVDVIDKTANALPQTDQHTGWPT